MTVAALFVNGREAPIPGAAAAHAGETIKKGNSRRHFSPARCNTMRVTSGRQ
jgi:hypothetical protein